MELSDKAEEILELLLVATQDNPGAAVPRSTLPPGDEDALAELTGADLVSTRDDSIALTETGREEARGVLRRHCLAERLLADVLDVGDEALLHQTACRFEHVIRRGIDDHICTLLGHPRFCPHGTPIPPGPCCRENRDTAHPVVAPLADLPVGAAGRIAYIHTQERSGLDKLIAMGALPGAEVTVVQTFPSYVFQVGHTQVAVDRQIADSIYVRSEPHPPAPRRRRWRLGYRR